jgi:hypothetical protein
VIDVASTGGWQNWSTVQADNIQLSAGTHQLTIFIIQAGFNLNRMTFFLTAQGIEDENSGHPLNYRLEQNYPNPFNPETTFRYTLAKGGNVQLEIYNAIGEKVETVVKSNQVAGEHEVRWNATHLAGGVYYYRLRVSTPSGQAGDFVNTKKLIVMK